MSYNINDVIDYRNLEIDPEGFNNYLDFGYSVFQQTPIKHVKFLRHSSRLSIDDRHQIKIDYLDDPIEKWMDFFCSEEMNESLPLNSLFYRHFCSSLFYCSGFGLV